MIHILLMSLLQYSLRLIKNDRSIEFTTISTSSNFLRSYSNLIDRANPQSRQKFTQPIHAVKHTKQTSKIDPPHSRHHLDTCICPRDQSFSKITSSWSLGKRDEGEESSARRRNGFKRIEVISHYRVVRVSRKTKSHVNRPIH